MNDVDYWRYIAYLMSGAAALLGLILTRYVVPLEPIASMTADEVVGVYAPVLQRYLFGALHD